MSDKNKEVGIRLSVKDKEVVERALRSVGTEGQAALKRIELSAEQASVSLNALDAAANGVNKGMDRLKAGIALAGAAIVTGFIVGIRGAIQRMEEMDKMSAQVDRALSNTGNTAKTSAAELAEFADELERRTGRAAEDIMAIGGNLATFKFDHEVYYRSIELANDMSAAWGGELKQNLEGLARALADPEKGFAMLEKRGISLTDQQGDLVKRFLAVNDVASAQRVILSALEDDVKGVAEQGLTPLQRSTMAAEKAMEDLFEDLVRGEGDADDLRRTMDTLTNTLSDPNVLEAVRMFGNVLITVLRTALEYAGGVAAGIGRVIDLFKDLEGKSDAGLDQRLYEVGVEIVDLDRQRMQKSSALRNDVPAWDISGQISNNLAQGDIADIEGRTAKLREEEKTILQLLESRKPAEIPPTEIKPTSTGDIPPPVLDDAGKREAARAAREALKVTEQLQSASEEYAATIHKLDQMLANGSITQSTYNRGAADAALALAAAAEVSVDYANAQAALSQALQRGIITEAQYTDAVEAMTGRRLEASDSWVSGIELGLLRVAERGGNIGDDIADSLVSGVDRFEDAWLSALETGEFKWQDFAKSILLDLARMSTRNLITGPVSSFLGGLFGGGGGALGNDIGKGIGGAFSGGGLKFNADGGVYSGSGINAYSNQIVDKPTFFPFASGGGVMGEAGPEAIIPLRRGPDGRLGVGGGASAMQVTLAPVYHIPETNLSQDQLLHLMEQNNRSLLAQVPGTVRKSMGQGYFG